MAAPTLKEQAIRLLREKWANPTILAEELYAILSQDQALESSSGMTLDGTGDGSGNGQPLQFRNYGDDQPIIRIRRPDNTFDDVTPEDLLGGGSGGGTGGGSGTPAPTAAVLQGIVGARIDGSTYSVADAESGEAFSADCIPELAAGEVIPAGTRVPLFVSRSGAAVAANFTVPTWL